MGWFDCVEGPISIGVCMSYVCINLNLNPIYILSAIPSRTGCYVALLTSDLWHAARLDSCEFARGLWEHLVPHHYITNYTAEAFTGQVRCTPLLLWRNSPRLSGWCNLTTIIAWWIYVNKYLLYLLNYICIITFMCWLHIREIRDNDSMTID